MKWLTKLINRLRIILKDRTHYVKRDAKVAQTMRMFGLDDDASKTEILSRQRKY